MLANQVTPVLTADPVADRVLAGFVSLLGRLAPGRVRAVYLSGSFAAGTAAAGSDLDVLVVLRSDAPAGFVAWLAAAAKECGELTAVPLDVTVLTEAEAVVLGRGWFVGAKRLVHGADLLPGLPPSDPVRSLGWLTAARMRPPGWRGTTQRKPCRRSPAS